MFRSITVRRASVSAVSLLVLAATSPWSPAQANSAGNTVFGGFEIDGNFYEGFDNTSTATGPDGDPVDWGSTEIADDVEHIVDPTGNADETVYGQGAKEDDLSSWQNDGSQAAPGQADIGNIYLYDRVVGDDQYAYIAFDRAETTGTVTWYLELNQKPNTTNGHGVSVPDRSVNDLRLTMKVQGTSNLTVDEAHVWDGSGWATASGGSAWAALANDSTITTSHGSLARGRFMEAGFNLTALLGEDGTCLFSGYEALNLRSQSGGSGNAQLKDYATGTIDIPSRCGNLVIEKRDTEGNLLGGATFHIAPNPIPGAGDPASLTITDDDANDADPTDGVISINPAEPGDYTITEVSPPPGYIQTDAPQDVTLEEYGSATVVFENRLGTLAWEKVDKQTREPVCCATFTVVATAGDAFDAGVSLTVIDNGTNDDDPADGAILVGGLMTGTYTITETVPPIGYELPANPIRAGVVISANTPDVVLPKAFKDPQVRSELEIVKLDATTGEELAGATFVVRIDDGDGVFDPAADHVLDPPGEVTTDATGTVTVGGLLFGTYWVEETAPPTGYELPDPAYQGPYTFGPDNAGTTVTVTFEDPQIRTDLSVIKLDGADESGLAGAVFELYLDGGDGAPEAPAGDTLIDECTTGADGTCTIGGLEFGTYYWYEVQPPTGYDLPEDRYSAMIVINAANAGTELAPVPFYDPRKPGDLSVLKLDEADGRPLGGALFHLYLDNGDGTFDEDSDTFIGECATGADGTCTVGELDFGTYFWIEVQPPTGYDLPDNPVSGPIVVNAGNVEGGQSAAEFTDPRIRSELTVLKLDETDGEPLAGGVFELYLDDGDGTPEAPTGDTLIDECTTGADGTCTIGELDFGTYYWYEVQPPTGYDLAEDRYSDMIVIAAANAGTPYLAVFEDPRVLSELTVLKLAEDTGEPLAGAVFELYLDDGDGVAQAPDGDLPVNGCVTGENGTCTVSGLDFGEYYWYELQAPPGYLLPEVRTSEIASITAANAGTSLTVVTFLDPPEPDEPEPTPTPTPEPSPEPTEPPKEPELPDTGSSITLGLVAAALAAVLAGAALVTVRRRHTTTG